MFCWRSREQAPCVQSAVYLLALLFWRTSIIFYKVQNVIFCICQLNQTFWFYICFISQQNFSLFCTLFKFLSRVPFYVIIGVMMSVWQWRGFSWQLNPIANIWAHFPAPAPRHLAVLMLLLQIVYKHSMPPAFAHRRHLFISWWACKTWPNHFNRLKECVKIKLLTAMLSLSALVP